MSSAITQEDLVPSSAQLIGGGSNSTTQEEGHTTVGTTVTGKRRATTAVATETAASKRKKATSTKEDEQQQQQQQQSHHSAQISSSNTDTEIPLIPHAASVVTPQPKRTDGTSNAAFHIWFSNNFPSAGFLKPACVIVARSEKEAIDLLDSELERKKLKTFNEKSYKLHKLSLVYNRVVDMTSANIKISKPFELIQSQRINETQEDSNEIDVEQDLPIEPELKKPALFYSTDFRCATGELCPAAFCLCEADMNEAFKSLSAHLVALGGQPYNAKKHPFSFKVVGCDSPSVHIINSGAYPGRFVPERF